MAIETPIEEHMEMALEKHIDISTHDHEQLNRTTRNIYSTTITRKLITHDVLFFHSRLLLLVLLQINMIIIIILSPKLTLLLALLRLIIIIIHPFPNLFPLDYHTWSTTRSWKASKKLWTTSLIVVNVLSVKTKQ